MNSGWKPLNNIHGGVRRGELVVLVANSNTPKSKMHVTKTIYVPQRMETFYEFTER